MKQKMKRLLAAMLVAVMFLSVGQGFSLNMELVFAEETSSSSSSSASSKVVERELFSANFEGTTTSDDGTTINTLSTDGWDDYSRNYTSKSDPKNSRFYITDTKETNTSKSMRMTTSGDGAAGAWLEKKIDVTGLDNVTVEFQYYMEGIVVNASKNWYPHLQLKCVNGDANTGNSTTPRIFYREYESGDLNTWISIKVEINYDETTGKWNVESYKQDADGNWEAYADTTYEDKSFEIIDNEMYLCFYSYLRKGVAADVTAACGGTLSVDQQSCYIDDVRIYTENTETVVDAKNMEFATDFEEDTQATLEAVGWEFSSTNDAVKSKFEIAEAEGNKYLKLTSKNTNSAKPRIKRDVDVSELDNLTVQFDFIAGDKDAGENGYSAAKKLYLYHGNQDMDKDVTGLGNLPNFWTGLSTEWQTVKVVFDVAENGESVISSAYIMNDGEWEEVSGYQNVEYDTDNGVLHLNFLMYLSDSSYYAYLDNLEIYTTTSYAFGLNRTYTSPTIQNGASVRVVENSSGIRFIGEVNKADLAELEAITNVAEVKYGMAITPATYINTDYSGFTFFELSEKYAENPYLMIEADPNKNIDNGDSYEFRCAMIGLSSEIYNWKFAARSYYEIVYENGSVHYVYSPFVGAVNVRSVQEVATAALADTSETYTDTEISILKDYAGYDSVYLSSANGSDENDGTLDAPFATLGKAFASVQNYGEIIITDTCTVESDFVWPTSDKTITIKGASDADTNTLSFEDSTINIRSNVTIDDVKLSLALNNKSQSFIYANGYTVKFGQGVATSEGIFLYGGGNSTTVASTNLTVLGGNYERIRGGSNAGIVEGDTHLHVGGTTNKVAEITNHNLSHKYAIYGGGHNDTVEGNTYVTFTGEAKATYLYGGSSGTGNVGITNVTFSGGKVMCLHGGNNNSGTISGVNVIVTGGEMEQLFGANLESSMTGNVSIDLQGGKITRRVYGGCYNEYTGSNYATGNINLKISSGVTISLDALYADRTISASSRYATKTDEVCTIIFVDEVAYDEYFEQCEGYDSIVKSYE